MSADILRDLSLLWSLFHVLILFSLLYRSKYSRKKTFFLTVLFMGPLIVLTLTGVIFLGVEEMGRLFVFSCTLPSLIFFYKISQDNKWRFLFTFCLSDTASLWIIIVTNLLDYYAGGVQCILMLVGRLVMFPLTEWFVVRYLRKPYLELRDSVSRYWKVFAAMSALYYVLLVVVANYPVIITKRQQEMPVLILILILMPLTYATIFVSLYQQLMIYRRSQAELIWKEQKRQLEAQLENQQKLRRIRHDLKAHTITLSGLLAADKIEEAQSYMWNMVYEMDEMKQICANPYLNSVFSHFVQKFAELETELKLDLKIGDEELPFMELCQILSNGLENALDASRELCPDKRSVSVQMCYSREYLIIRVKNGCKGSLNVKRGELPATTKEGTGHGFGLTTIKEAAAKLEGEMICYTSAGSFVLDVMVRVQEYFNSGKAVKRK